jgi:integrase
MCNDRGMAKPTKTSSGKYRVIVDFQGRRKSATFPTLKAARTGQARMLVELGSQPVALTATVGDILAEHLAEASTRLSANYVYAARNVVSRVPASMNDLPAESVTAFQLESAYRAMVADGWGVHSIYRLHAFLGAAFKRAVRYKLVTANPMASVEPPPRPPAEIHPPTAEQVRALIAAARTPLCALAYSLAAATGARRGELVGLRWGDIDFDAGRISIVRSLAYTPGVGIHERPTKTGAKGRRVLTVDGDTMGLLATRRDAYPSGEWVLSPLGGIDPWSPLALSRAFERDLAAAGEAGFTFHSLRHFSATRLLSAGVDPWIVSRRLGHTTPSTTLSTYAHWIPGTDAGAAEAIARVMRGD